MGMFIGYLLILLGLMVSFANLQNELDKRLLIKKGYHVEVSNEIYKENNGKEYVRRFLILVKDGEKGFNVTQEVKCKIEVES